jgi:RNA polymerase sigma-70 factor (family 1)
LKKTGPYPTDGDLVISLKNDKLAAFDHIYWKYSSAVLRNIDKILKDKDESENILQEVFIALWENREKLDPERSLANWLFTVSFNKSINCKKKILREELLCRQLELNAGYDTTNDAITREAQQQLIEEAMTHLSPQKRKVFDLCKIQGKTYEETAKELGISKYTVKEYLTLAVKYVREYVELHAPNQTSIIYIVLLFKLFTEKRS